MAVVPGEAFGSPGYFRMSYALGDDDLVEGVTRLAACSPGADDRGGRRLPVGRPGAGTVMLYGTIRRRRGPDRGTLEPGRTTCATHAIAKRKEHHG